MYTMPGTCSMPPAMPAFNRGSAKREEDATNIAKAWTSVKALIPKISLVLRLLGKSLTVAIIQSPPQTNDLGQHHTTLGPFPFTSSFTLLRMGKGVKYTSNYGRKRVCLGFSASASASSPISPYCMTFA